ncbi:hypothetical protein ACFL1X_04535 [Candidatus Hydrogenedentota bacterium]
MRRRHHTKLIHEGDYVAEVDVELVDVDKSWAPYLTLSEAQKLDDVRDALRRKDLKEASRYARIYILTPATL